PPPSSPSSTSRSSRLSLPTCLSLAQTSSAPSRQTSLAPPASALPLRALYPDIPASQKSFSPHENPDDSCARALPLPATPAPSCETPPLSSVTSVPLHAT